MSSFGELTGLRLDRSPKRLEIVPYVSGDVETKPVESGNPLSKRSDPDASVGVDLKYALRPGLTLTGTVNPDFGQVEADPAEVNLSAFETFFPERRPFFVEGSGVFRFDLDCNDGNCSGLFYSRRIGRTPRGEAEVPDGGYSSAPLQTTILGAGEADGEGRGVFDRAAECGHVRRGRADCQRLRAHTRRRSSRSTSYSVLRARREFANQSTVGFMATSTNRNLDDATRFLPGQAYTGGVDWDWRLSSKYAVQGYWAGSSVHGDAEAIDTLQRSNVHSFQRPDSTRPELRSAAHVAEWVRRVGDVQQDRRPARPVHDRTSASRVPGSRSTTSASCAARTSAR